MSAPKMSKIYTKEGEQKYSPEAVADLKGTRYAIVQSSGNRMAVQIVDDNGYIDWWFFGGAGRTKKAIADAKRWVGLKNNAEAA